jgi:hypothetical protein
MLLKTKLQRRRETWRADITQVDEHPASVISSNGLHFETCRSAGGGYA